MAGWRKVVDLRGCQMVWTYCSICGRRSGWAASCSECGAANPLYGLAVSSRACGGAGGGGSPPTFLQSWGYLAAVLLVCSVALTILLLFPLVFR